MLGESGICRKEREEEEEYLRNPWWSLSLVFHYPTNIIGGGRERGLVVVVVVGGVESGLSHFFNSWVQDLPSLLQDGDIRLRTFHQLWGAIVHKMDPSGTILNCFV